MTIDLNSDMGEYESPSVNLRSQKILCSHVVLMFFDDDISLFQETNELFSKVRGAKHFPQKPFCFFIHSAHSVESNSYRIG